ncbi:MAG: hypothetical protein IKC08_07725, partial [Lentisphaeria bacterium]|nr:hypothetical protein [Lentisphaeria bacterium]
MPSPISQTPLSREKLIYCILLFLILFLLYLPGLSYPFMLQWDDATFITANPHLAFTFENLKLYFTKPFQDLYTPLTMVSLMADHAVSGFSVTGYHIHNLLLHILCAILFFFLLLKFKIRPLLAFLCSLLWALNPQKIESVIWITERKDVLSGALALGSFLLFVHDAEKKKLPLASSILGILALLAKPSVLPLPGVMVVYLITVWGKRHSLKEYARILLLPVCSFLFFTILSAQITAQTFPGVFEWRFPVWIYNILWYPFTAIFPTVHPFYPLYLGDIRPYIPIYILAPLTAVLLVFWAKKVRLSTAKITGYLLVTGGLTVPVLGLIVYTYYDQADRYNYLVSLGVWAFLAAIAERTNREYPETQKYLKGILAAAGIIYFVYSWLYLPYWEKCEYLFARCLEDKRPCNVMFYDNGSIAAYASGNHKLLQAISDRMIRDHKAYKDAEAQYLSGLAYGLHAAIIKKDYAAALPYYKELDTMYKRKGGLKKNYWPYFFHNMAIVSAWNNEYEKSVEFLKIFFRLHNRKKHNILIF